MTPPEASEERIAPETGKLYEDGRGLKVRIMRCVPDFVFLPLRRVRYLWRLFVNVHYDFMQLRRYSSAVDRGDTREKLRALLTMQYHGVEKGLSLRNPRPGFGKPRVRLLLGQLERFTTHFGWDVHSASALRALEAYCAFNRRSGSEDQDVENRVEKLVQAMPGEFANWRSGGVKEVSRDEFLGAAKKDLRGFYDSRSSVRQFSAEPVDHALLEEAVRIAQRSPCVCNRQSGRVRALTKKEDILAALEIQGGARGFEDQIPLLLVITSELAHFQSPGERNQCWIDGGLFAMTLIWGLHSQGLVSCCLNWSKMKGDDLLFKRRFSVPRGESILFLLAVGHPVEHYKVAQSVRKPLEEVLIVY